MKKKVLKNWVEYVLIVINLISLILVGSDSNNIGSFILIHFTSLVIFMGSSLMLIKYGMVR